MTLRPRRRNRNWPLTLLGDLYVLVCIAVIVAAFESGEILIAGMSR